ncbi:hypothetical protein [Rubrivirga sp.]|uniref:hypothetical protein n=1 Tax=Rubrivirga sp. TaxID=1885344 RepID=UPI003B522CDF
MTSRGLCPDVPHGWLEALALALTLVAFAAFAACDTASPPSGSFEATVSGSGVRYALDGEATFARSAGCSALVVALRDRARPERVVSITVEVPAEGAASVGPGVRLGYAAGGQAALAASVGEVRLARVGPGQATGTFEADLALASGEPTAFRVEGAFDAVRAQSATPCASDAAHGPPFGAPPRVF